MSNTIFDFVKKLLPRIERQDIEEDLRLTEKELINVSMPAFEAAKDFLNVNPPKSKQFNNLQASFYQVVNTPKLQRGSNFVSDISTRLKTLHDNVVHLQGVIGESLDKDIMSAGMTMRAAFLMRAAANISHISRYVLSLLNYVYTVEALARNEDTPHTIEISKQEIKYVEANFTRFATLLSHYTIPTKDFEKMIKELPEVYVNESTRKAVEASAKFDTISKTYLAGFVGSPIYAVRLMIAQWQNDRYESTKAKKTQLELRLLYLKSQEENGHQDPAIEREISRLQDRIEKLDNKIHETENEILGE